MKTNKEEPIRQWKQKKMADKVGGNTTVLVSISFNTGQK